MTLLLSACAKDSPYDQYVAAYQYIWEADSFITEIAESDFESRTLPDNTVEAYSFSGESLPNWCILQMAIYLFRIYLSMMIVERYWI